MSSIRPVPVVLAPLMRYLDNLTGRAPLDELSRLLTDLRIPIEDMRDYLLNPISS